MSHIPRRKNDFYIHFWCPYCNKIHPFGFREGYDDCFCTNCKRMFPPHFWPKGIDRLTGELEEQGE